MHSNLTLCYLKPIYEEFHKKPMCFHILTLGNASANIAYILDIYTQITHQNLNLAAVVHHIMCFVLSISTFPLHM